MSDHSGWLPTVVGAAVIVGLRLIDRLLDATIPKGFVFRWIDRWLRRVDTLNGNGKTKTAEPDDAK